MSGKSGNRAKGREGLLTPAARSILISAKLGRGRHSRLTALTWEFPTDFAVHILQGNTHSIEEARKKRESILKSALRRKITPHAPLPLLCLCLTFAEAKYHTFLCLLKLLSSPRSLGGLKCHFPSSLLLYQLLCFYQRLTYFVLPR